MSNHLISLQNVFRDVLDDQELELTPDQLLQDIPQCDSVALIQVILMIENLWGISFETDEVAGVRSVGNLLDLIETYSN